MPLRKHIEDDAEDHRDLAPAQPLSPFAGFAEAGWAAFEYVTGGFLLPKFTQPPDVPRVGKYYADYSELKPEEIQKLDDDCAELFKRSKPVSR
jgi:hypothetical protein